MHEEEAPDTITSFEQRRVEEDVINAFRSFVLEDQFRGDNKRDPDGGEDIIQPGHIFWDAHVAFLKKALTIIPRHFSGLDASRPWFVFWITHSLDLLGALDREEIAPRIASFLAKCQSPPGGFGGGPMQLAHLAPTYASMASIAIAGTEEAYNIVDRAKIYDFLIRMKDESGGFRMHDNGEVDMRGTYCAIAAASMLRLITPELTQGVAEYVRSCQNWEGGIAGEENLEAHGGYGYCGLAALAIIDEADKLDLPAFLHWAINRQMAVEGGFNGRTNKLVDSCYSFWQGAVFPILHHAMGEKGYKVPEEHFWMSPGPLQAYIMLACQNPTGGLRDKPGKSVDFYHSCYSLSGFAATQYGPGKKITALRDNILARTDIFYNINLEYSQKLEYFDGKPLNGIMGTEGAGARRWREKVLAELNTVQSPVTS